MQKERDSLPWEAFLEVTDRYFHHTYLKFGSIIILNCKAGWEHVGFPIIMSSAENEYSSYKEEEGE